MASTITQKYKHGEKIMARRKMSITSFWQSKIQTAFDIQGSQCTESKHECFSISCSLFYKAVSMSHSVTKNIWMKDLDTCGRDVIGHLLEKLRNNVTCRQNNQYTG
jgi:hypothetical protein